MTVAGLVNRRTAAHGTKRACVEQVAGLRALNGASLFALAAAVHVMEAWVVLQDWSVVA